MNAEVIAIGDELTSGQRLDTNSPWLSDQLEQLGVSVLFHTTVGDDLDACTLALRQAIQRAGLVVATGGLGPTADDITRQALAAATDRPLVLDEQALAHITALFARRGRSMPPQNRVQAMFPEGSAILPNADGTAPGIDLTIERPPALPCRIIVLPGVPAEMFAMWRNTVAPALRSWLGTRRMICHRRIQCFGVGESDLEAMLPDLVRRGRDPRVGITVHRATITLRITTSGASEEECRQKMEPTIQTIRQCLGELVFGEEDDQLQHAVVRALRERGKTLAVAEWGTQGIVTRWLSESDSVPCVFRGGLVAGDGRQLALWLHVPMALVEKQNGISPELAVSMARAVRELAGSAVGLATTQVPQRPDAIEPFFIGVSSPELERAEPRIYAGHPDIVRERAAKQAIDLIRRLLRSGQLG